MFAFSETPITNIHRVYINITVAALFVDIMYIKERKNFQKDIKMAEKNEVAFLKVRIIRIKLGEAFKKIQGDSDLTDFQ